MHRRRQKKIVFAGTERLTVPRYQDMNLISIWLQQTACIQKRKVNSHILSAADPFELAEIGIRYLDCPGVVARPTDA